MRNSLDRLPQDVLIHLTTCLDAVSLAAVARTCSKLRAIALEHGYPALIRQLRLLPITLHRDWSAEKQALFAHQLDQAIRATDCIVSPLASWTFSLPVVAMHASRVVIAAGTSLQTIAFDDHALPIRSPPTQSKQRRKRGVEDISALLLWDSKTVLGRVSGAIELVDAEQRELARFGSGKGTVQALSSYDGIMASAHTVGRAGIVSLHQLRSPWTAPISVRTEDRPWSLQAGDGWLAVGQAGTDPLSVFALSESGFAESRQLGRKGDESRTAVYALAKAALGSVLPPQCLVSGWYDGATRIYDLRAGSDPCLTLSTRWSEDAIFSIASSGYLVAAGMARHSAIRIADLRNGSGSDRDAGLTLFAAARQASPVYSLAMEGSRIFAATSTGAVMLEYGPDVVARAFDNPYDRHCADPWADWRPRFQVFAGDVKLHTSRPCRM